MIKKLVFKNETTHNLVFNTWSQNKVTDNTNLYPMKPQEVRELEVLVPDDTYVPVIEYLSEHMIIPQYTKA